eukprot:TRINITY_DN4414_c0_g1_i2.p1 TRINITY_DN4414_c0_g1~~TRINITY_DN4414_c0_g1_i2.p1  ORF type:complete len:636 (+),score=108.23 TRINITY_DN4414_c0_g1_i2:56-1909(+)
MSAVWSPMLVTPRESPVLTPHSGYPAQAPAVIVPVDRQGDRPGAAISARERKQVYMHSTLFQGGGAAPQNVYLPSRQEAVIGEIKKSSESLPLRREAIMPSPADFRATVNSGHWVVTPRVPPSIAESPPADPIAARTLQSNLTAPVRGENAITHSSTEVMVGTQSASALSPTSPQQAPSLGHALNQMRQASEGYSGKGTAGGRVRRVTIPVHKTGGEPVQKKPGSADDSYMLFNNDAEPVHLVHAKKTDGDGMIPKEYLMIDSQVQWLDNRCNLANVRRGQEFHAARKAMDANERKRQEQSSEVLGNIRRMEKSTLAPGSEVRSCPFKDMHSVDSCLDRKVPAEQLRETEARGSMTARERAHRNLNQSTLNQFPKRDTAPGPVRRTDITVPPGEKNGAETRRKQERNYSDLLFGTPVSARYTKDPAQEKKMISRGEPTGCTSCSFLDSQVEITYRQRSPRASEKKAEPAEDKGEPKEVKMWPLVPACESPRGLSPRAKNLGHEERACWDTTGIMQANAELSRRLRDRLKGGPSEESLNKSAPQRKRAELASTQVRAGTHRNVSIIGEDGNTVPPLSPKPSWHVRSGTSSPRGLANQNIMMQSPRMRRVESLMSNVVF